MIAELNTDNPAAALSTIWSAGIDGTGNVSLVTSGINTIHQFRFDGAWIKNVGREGSGPGEFRGISCVSVGKNGDLLVYDGHLNRVTHLQSDGTYLNSITIPSVEVVRKGLHLANSDHYWISDLRRSSVSPDKRIRRLRLIGSDSEVLWSSEYEGTEPFIRYDTGRGPSIIIPNPAGKDLLWDIDEAGSLWMLTADQDSLRHISSNGEELLAVATRLRSNVLTREEWSEFVNTVIWFVEEFKVPILRDAAEPLRESLNNTRDMIRPIQRIWCVDSLGLLVDRNPYRHPNSGADWPLVQGRYACLLSNGQLTEEVEGPGGLVIASNGYALCLESRADDLPKLTLYQLIQNH